jgi:GLPGLI family protein
MKKGNFLIVLLVIAFSSVNHSYAQKKVNEATITYNISITSSDEKAAMAKTLEGATLTVYLKGTQSRTDMTSALGMESNLYDSRLHKGIILKQYSGQKLMITLTPEDWSQKNQVYQNLKFSIDNKEEQTISGFKCRKATGTSGDGKVFIIYFTADVVLSNKQYENAFAQLPGLPVQYELQSGGLKFKYTLNTISYEPVPAAKFEIPKTGYRVMSYAETQELKKGTK